MIHLIDKENRHFYQKQLEQSYALRHRIFVQEKKWHDLERGDGLDIDQFDNDDAIYMLYIDENNSVLGCQRMLSSLKPHLLSHVLPHLCDGNRPVGPNVWEWTRFAVESSKRERGRMLSPAAMSLLIGIVEWGLSQGIDTIIIQMNQHWLLRLIQMHFRVMPLGFPEDIDGEPTIAVTAQFNKLTLAKLQEIRGSDEPVLYRGLPPSFVSTAA